MSLQQSKYHCPNSDQKERRNLAEHTEEGTKHSTFLENKRINNDSTWKKNKWENGSKSKQFRG